MRTTTDHVTFAPNTRPALEHVTVPDANPQAALADTNEVPAGTASVRVKPALSDGPRLSTGVVCVSSVPAVPGDGSAVFVTFRSALRLTVVDDEEVSLPEF